MLLDEPIQNMFSFRKWNRDLEPYRFCLLGGNPGYALGVYCNLQSGFFELLIMKHKKDNLKNNITESQTSVWCLGLLLGKKQWGLHQKYRLLLNVLALDSYDVFVLLNVSTMLYKYTPIKASKSSAIPNPCSCDLRFLNAVSRFSAMCALRTRTHCCHCYVCAISGS